MSQHERDYNHPSRIYYNPYVNQPNRPWTVQQETNTPNIPFLENPEEGHSIPTEYGAQPTHYYKPELTHPTPQAFTPNPKVTSNEYVVQPSYYQESPLNKQTFEQSFMNPKQTPAPYGAQPTHYYKPELTNPTPQASTPNPKVPSNEYGVQPTYYLEPEHGPYGYGEPPTHYMTHTKNPQGSYQMSGQHPDSLQMPNPNAPTPKYLFTGPNINTQEQVGGKGTHYHIHEFNGKTKSADGHEHHLTGTTEPAPNNAPDHRHPYWAVTTYQDGHRHEVKGMSGPAIPLQGGGHIHVIEGETYGYPNHQHKYEEKTAPSKK